MSETVKMPALGESVTEGTVTRWLKSVGDTVEVDESLLEVSTDKVDTEIPSPVAGTIEKILVEEDEDVLIHSPLSPSSPSSPSSTLSSSSSLESTSSASSASTTSSASTLISVYSDSSTDSVRRRIGQGFKLLQCCALQSTEIIS